MACTLLRRLFRRRLRGSVAFTPVLLPQQASTATSASFAPNTARNALDSLYLLNTMAGQGSHQLIIYYFPDHLNTSELVLKYSTQAGYLNASTYNRANHTIDVVIDFATASDAAMALANFPSVTLGDRTFAPANEDFLTLSEPEDIQSRKKMKITHEKTVERPKCKICFEKVPEAYATPCLQCKSAWCYGCLKSWFTIALKDQSVFPARCCDKVMHYDTVRGILPASEYDKYRTRYEEFSTPKPIYCGNPKCSAFLPPRLVQQDTNKKLSCYACGTQTCSKCRNVVDNCIDHNCSAADTTAKMLNKFSYKRCPRCDGGVAHMYGCPHVRCQCGAHWCWDCQRPIKICWRNPCVRSREDGNQTEEDVGPETESEVNTESGDTPENITNPEDGGQTIHLPEQQAEQATVSTTTTDVTSLQPQNGASDVMASDSTSVITVIATQEVEPMAVEAQVQPTLPQPNVDEEESNINLDASDFDDWEGGDFDFGEEPQDEAWDTWGCIHRLQALLSHKIPEFWLPNKAHEVECMNCFNVTAIKDVAKREKAEKEADDAVLRGRARTVSWPDNETASEVCSDRPNSAASTVVGSYVSDNSTNITRQTDLTTPNEPSVSVQSKCEQSVVAPEGKPKVFNCTICGVIYCFKCKKVVTSAINAQLKKK